MLIMFTKMFHGAMYDKISHARMRTGFGITTEIFVLPMHVNELIVTVFFCKGASHSDELALLFQMPWISDVFEDSRDYTMSLDLVKLWVSFAKHETNEK